MSVEALWRVLSNVDDLAVSREDVDDAWRSRSRVVVEDSRMTESECNAGSSRLGGGGGSSSSLSTLAGGEGGGGPKWTSSLLGCTVSVVTNFVTVVLVK